MLILFYLKIKQPEGLTSVGSNGYEAELTHIPFYIVPHKPLVIVFAVYAEPLLCRVFALDPTSSMMPPPSLRAL